MRHARLHRRAPERGRPRRASAGDGRDAVDADADAHHVVARARHGDRAGGVARVHDAGREMPRARIAASTASNVALLRGGVVVARFVGDREVRAHAGQPQLRPGRRRARRARRRPPGSHPTRCMPVSTFRCTSSGSRDAGAWRTAFASASMPVAVYTTGVRRCATTVSAAAGTGSDSTRIGRVDPGVAQLHALFDERDREAVGAGLERGAAHLDRAVPVAVGLHDRAQPRPARPARATTATFARTASRSTSAQTGRNAFHVTSSGR